MRRFAPLFVAVALTLPALARAELTSSDQDFLTKAAQGNMDEVKLGQLAATHAQSAAVKSFGKKMVTDHGKAVVQIKALATKKNLALPTDVSQDQQKKYDDLAKQSGADFDKAYMDAMVQDHDQDVAEFQSAAKTAKDKDVRGLAKKLLPTLKRHQKMAHAGAMPKTM